MRKLNIINTNIPALVDDEDYEILNQYKWYYILKGECIRRAATEIEISNGMPSKIRLARQIMNFSFPVIDHIDGRIFNNCKSNLRGCTQSQNSKNQNKPQGRYSSKYKGVSKAKDKWHSYIKVNYKKKHLGVFVSEVDAAISYNKAAIKYFGKFAKLNEIDQKENNYDKSTNS